LNYAKIDLYDSLVATEIPDEKHCRAEVFAYFPKRLSVRFKSSILSHRLVRQIAAMLISNSMINRMGPSFAVRAQNDTGGDAADIARAYAIVRELFDTRGLWRQIEELDGQLQAQVQYECFYECSRMVRRAVYWFLHRRNKNRNIETSTERKRKEVSAVLADLPSVLCGWSKRRFESDAVNLESVGVPKVLAGRIAALRLLTQVLDIASLSHELKIDPLTVARLHFELGRGLRLDWIREQIEELHVEGHWSAIARSTLRESLGREQRALLQNVLKGSSKGQHRAALAEWLAASNAAIVRLKRTLDEMQASGQMDFAILSIALKEIGRLH
jgi:glutamate dehydrogenase